MNPTNIPTQQKLTQVSASADTRSQRVVYLDQQIKEMITKIAPPLPEAVAIKMIKVIAYINISINGTAKSRNNVGVTSWITIVVEGKTNK